MLNKDFLVFFSILQMVVMFGLIPPLVLYKTYGTKAVVIYSITSLIILISFAIHLWKKGRIGPRKAEPGALGFGMILAFLSSEIVAAAIMIL